MTTYYLVTRDGETIDEATTLDSAKAIRAYHARENGLRVKIRTSREQ